MREANQVRARPRSECDVPLRRFAVLHFVTQGRNGRGFMLFLAWFTTIVFGLPGLLMAALGLADHVFDFRKLKLTPQS